MEVTKLMKLQREERLLKNKVNKVTRELYAVELQIEQEKFRLEKEKAKNEPGQARNSD